MRNSSLKIGFTATGLLLPTIALAMPEDFSEVVDVIVGILNTAIPVIFALALIAILWAAAQMILNGDNPQKMADGRRTLTWGIIVLFIMVSMWGFVNLIAGSFF